MGADGGGSRHKPHPAAQKPTAPCDDEGPDRSCWFDIPWNRPPIGNARPQQVSEPAVYAVAGKILLAAAGALAGVLLALVAMYLYNSTRRRRLGSRRRLDRSPAIAGAGREDLSGGGATPRGLDPAVLRALPVVAAGDGAGDCTVCLAELEPGEKLRALPRCAHLFHAECIDAWFRGNATCPLCRADIVAPDAAEEWLPDVRINVAVEVNDATTGKTSMPPAMRRLPSGTDLGKTRRAFFASTRSASF